jgi:hypothetical protein
VRLGSVDVVPHDVAAIDVEGRGDVVATGNGNFISVRERCNRLSSSSMLTSRNATVGSFWYVA